MPKGNPGITKTEEHRRKLSLAKGGIGGSPNERLSDTERRQAQGKRDYNLRSHYGITANMFNQLLVIQNGVCALCGGLPTGTNNRTKSLVVDHDAKTNRIRGLLCHGCNRGIGLLKESPKLLSRLVLEYLRGPLWTIRYKGMVVDRNEGVA